MRIVLLDTATLGEDVDLSPITSLGEATVYRSTAPEEVADRLHSAEVAVLNKVKLNESNLSNAEHLRLICVTATGYDNIDIEYCKRRGIAVCNVPGYSTDSVAQITVAMALTLSSHLNEYTAFVNDGSYTASGVANRLTPVYHELSSMTWGIFGGGAIGSRVAEIANAFGAKVLICRRQKEERYEQVDFDELCRRSDILSLHVPLNDGTRGILSAERIATMKQGAIVINVARGAVADEEALVRAIEDGRLGGLGIDVYTKEPFESTHPYTRILGRPNVCLTPHMAWGSFEARTRCVDVIAKNIVGFEKKAHQNRIV